MCYGWPVPGFRTLAPAKVNLVLRVGPRRSDGYHDIRSLMVPLGLADEVEVAVSTGRPGPVTCRCPGHPELDGSANLAARAAEALRRRLGRGDAVDVVVRKRIPITAGLGGGSSDAAAVLRCLARAWRVRDRRVLRAAALEAGSDVPFFLAGGPAWAAGRGERLRRARVPSRWILLAYPRSPALAIRAGDAYRWLDEARSGRSPPPRGRPRPDHPENDLMDPVLQRFPGLRTLWGWLAEAGAARPIMSGSGPTFFGAFADRAAASRAARDLAGRRVGGRGIDIVVVRTAVHTPGVSSWRSPRSASSRSTRTSSRRT